MSQRLAESSCPNTDNPCDLVGLRKIRPRVAMNNDKGGLHVATPSGREEIDIISSLGILMKSLFCAVEVRSARSRREVP